MPWPHQPNRAARTAASKPSSTRLMPYSTSATTLPQSAHIPPGRDGLFDLVKSLPATLRYENHIAAATGDFVILHGRFSGLGQTPAWVVADIVRMEDGVLAEHWDVIQDEATREQSRSGLPMFGDKFPA